ncbi:MAG: M16 family peptidase [Burkholderiaceae bacterium]|jgi:zinc protease|nr:MAG: M16 family peptidase [Burkholderiaceae bacterium]
MKRLLSLSWLLAGLLIAETGSAQTAPAAPPATAASAAPNSSAAPPGTLAVPPQPAAPQVTQFQLANGLTVLIKPDRRAPTAVQMLWVRAGAIDEVSGTTGVAHALEHMMFKGTADLGPGEFSRRVAAIGGRENAFTTTDATGYYQQVPKARLADVMQLEADRFAHNQWPDAEFRKEIEVVKEERRMRTDESPRAQLWEALNAAAFEASGYHHPVVGWMSDLGAMTPDDVRAFYRRWYVPANAVLVIAGDVDVAQVERLVKKYYGAIPARPVPIGKPRLEPPQKGLRRIDWKAPASQAYVALAFKVPKLESLDASDDAFALTVLAAVLDGYSGARLDRALTQGPDRVADAADASNGFIGRGPQLFVLDGVPAAGKTVQQVEQALRAQVAKIAQEGVSSAELERVKTQWVAGRIYQRDSLFAQARELGSDWIEGLPPDAEDSIIARLRAVTAEQVKAVAAKYFGDDQLTVGVLVPQPVDATKPRKAVPADLRDAGPLS